MFCFVLKRGIYSNNVLASNTATGEKNSYPLGKSQTLTEE